MVGQLAAVPSTVTLIVPVISFDGELVAPSPLVDQIADAYNEMLTHA